MSDKELPPFPWEFDIDDPQEECGGYWTGKVYVGNDGDTVDLYEPNRRAIAMLRWIENAPREIERLTRERDAALAAIAEASNSLRDLVILGGLGERVDP